MEKINIKVLEGVDIPIYDKYASGFELKVNSFKKLFKGKKSIDLSKELQSSISEGYIMLRPYERLLVGIGIFIDLPEGYELQIRSSPAKVTDTGLMVMNPPGVIDEEYSREICVLLYNASQFLNRVDINDIIAIGVITRYEKIKFNQVKEL